MTTPVGSIRIDLAIDGDDLWGDVAKAIAPVMAGLEDLDRRLNSLQRNFAATGRGAQRSSAAATAAVTAQSRAVERLADRYQQAGRASERASATATAGFTAAAQAADKLAAKYDKVARHAVQSGALSEAAIDHVTDAWQRQTRAIQMNTAARAANAAAPTGGPPQGGMFGGGGGGGGGRRGGRYTSGWMGAAVFNTGALALGSWPAMATGLMEVVGGLQQLAQAGLVLPGIFAGAASSIGTAVVGFKGMGAAISAINEGDIAAIAEATKDMAASAVETATAVSKLTQGPLKDLQKAVAQPMFEGVAQSLETFASRAIPRAQAGMVKVAGSWNDTMKTLLEVGGSDSTLSIMDRIFGNTAEGQKRANAAIEPLVKGFGTLAAAGTDVLPRLGDALTKVATRFSDFITKADEDGRLAKWIDQGLTGLADLGESFLNLGKMITGLTKASGTDDGGFLKWLRESTGELQKFINSAEGQERLGNFFREGREQIQQWLPVLSEMWDLFQAIYEASKTWTAVLLPALDGILSVLTSMPGLLEAALVGFLAFKTISPFAGLISQIGQVNTVLGAAGSGGRGGTGLLGKLSSARALGGVSLLAGGALTQNTDGTQASDPFSALATIGGGALAGSTFGPVGTAFGALAGAAVTLTQVFINQANEMEAKKREFLEGRRTDGVPAVVAPTPPPGLPPGPNFGPAVEPPSGTREVRIPNPATPNSNLRDMLGVPLAAAGSPDPFVSAEEGARRTNEQVALLRDNITSLPTGQVVLKEDTPEAIKRVQDLGYEVKRLPSGQVEIKVQYTLNGQPISREQLVTPIRVSAIPGEAPLKTGGGRADGGVLPGYSPGIDNMLVPMSGGEGVLIPEAVRGIGGSAAVYAINSMFRKGLSRKGYADGGVVDGGLAGFTAATDDMSVIGLLKQIRDLLAGKAGGPLPATANAVTSTGGGAVTGDTWADGRPRDPMREMLEAAISALGGDPAKFLPPLVERSVTSAVSTAVGDSGKTAFDAVTGGQPGIVNGRIARNAPGSTTGWFPGGTAGRANIPDAGLVPAAAALNDLIVQAFPAVKTIGGYRQDPHPDHPSGRALDIMIPGGTVRGGANPAGEQLGDQIWNALMATGIVDPTGSLWKTDTGGDHYDHIHARIAEGMENAIPGMLSSGALSGLVSDATGGNPLGYSGGGPVPVYIVNNPNASAGGGIGGPLVDGLAAGATEAAQNVAGSALDAVLGVGNRPLPADVASMDALTRERNPAALAAALGLQVGDYGRGPNGDPIMRNGGPGYDAAGRLFSDTAALTDRTDTSKDAVAEARHQQLLDIMTQVRDNGTEQVLKPIMQTAISEGIGALKDSVTTAIGSQMGQAAGPLMAEPIAAAVRSAIPAQPAAPAGGGGIMGAAGQAAAGVFMAQGGPVFGGKLGVDSVPIMAQHGEFVLDTGDVTRMGGPAGVERFRRALEAGKVKGFATGGGVIADGATLGAEFFGVADVPILGAVVGALVAVLLAMIGVEIEQRDTLNELTDEARQFRGEFQAFDAAGRIMNDTSALSERTGSSEQAAADERIRILKIVISELIKFIIQKIVIPITQAVGNAAIQAGAAAAGAAVNSQAPGAGGLVSGLISGAGTAALDVGMEAWSQAAGVLTPLITDVVGEALVGLFPNLFRDIFSGGWLAKIFGPRTAGVGGLAGGLAGLFGALVGGAATDGLFDEGGMARGRGFMHKAVDADELVLKPVETDLFKRFVAAMERGGFGSSGNTTVHAPITVMGGEKAGEQVRDSLLSLIN